MKNYMFFPLAWIAMVGAAANFELQKANSQDYQELSTPPVSVEQLTVQFGCDETFVARNQESSAVLTVLIPGILQRSYGKELPYKEKGEVGANAISVRLELGEHLNHWCTDIMELPPRINAVWKGISGKATVVLIEYQKWVDAEGVHPSAGPVSAEIHLEAMVLRREDNSQEVVIFPGLAIEATLGVPGGG